LTLCQEETKSGFVRHDPWHGDCHSPAWAHPYGNPPGTAVFPENHGSDVRIFVYFLHRRCKSSAKIAIFVYLFR
jgi:hypothetical protein